LKELRQVLVCALLASLILLAWEGAALERNMQATMSALPGEIAAAREDIAGRADAQATALRRELVGQVAIARQRADSRIGDSLKRVDDAIGEVRELRADVKPVLDQAAAIEKSVPAVIEKAGVAIDKAAAIEQDAKDSWDDEYFDVKASVESATVAMNTVAQAAPQMAAAAQKNADNMAGITGDLHTLTAGLTKKRSFWGKLWEGVKTASRFAGLL
jgi:hypothetical protein